jgi:hypothetical protein
MGIAACFVNLLQLWINNRPRTAPAQPDVVSRAFGFQTWNTCQNLFLERRGQILQIRWPRIGQSIDNRRFSSVLVQRKKPDEV